jgi:lipoprotein-releasing system permease protein
MFELSVACKYLIPRRRQLSVSIISLISVLVIALVVWLIVVFFSVTDGLEKNWVHKLTALTAPLRITPTEAYYHSYYYQVDGISEASGYASKTIREKQEASTADPYDPILDEEIPSTWPTPDRDAEGNVKDLVKLVYGSLGEIHHVPGLQGQDFELTATHIRLNLFRPSTLLQAHPLYGGMAQSTLAYPAYLGNFEGNNSHFGQTLLPVEERDLSNFLSLIGFSSQDTNEEGESHNTPLKPKELQRRLKHFFDVVSVKRLQTRASGWTLPRQLFPAHALWNVCVILKDQEIVRLVIPQYAQDRLKVQRTLEEQGLTVISAQVSIEEEALTLLVPHHVPQPISPRLPLVVAGGASFAAQLDPRSLERARRVEDLRFQVEVPIQETLLQGNVFYRGLEIASATLLSTDASEASPPWIYRTTNAHGSAFVLPKSTEEGEGILLPKSFRDAGVLIGDRGSLSYLAPTASLLQEQLIPVYVAGFYDPGIIPIGGKFILANPDVTSLIRSSHQQEDRSMTTNGINVRFHQLDQADLVKAHLLEAFKNKGIQRYWNVETYREYEFTKEIMQELQSQKNLFMLIALVIIVVACSNIISMLIILVNDKKVEIGILRSMGASSKSIALIFGLAGAAIGVFGSVIGIVAAILTLHSLDTLVGWLSLLQGHDMFSATLYGQNLPHELSFEALSFVLMATVLISLLAGIVPAIKACLLRPTHILRASGG